MKQFTILNFRFQIVALIALAVFQTPGVWADGNTNVTNGDTHPVPVKVLSNYTSPSVTSAPGTTPSPSPAMLVNIQGNASGIAVPVTAPAALLVKPSQIGTATADVILKATTAATGTNWTAFGSQTCSVLTVVNTTGTSISVRIGGAGETVELPDGSGQTVSVAANASEVGVKRADSSNTQVDVKAVSSK